MPKSIHTCKDLYSFMRILEKHSLCPGVFIEKYHDLPIDSDAPIFKKKDGQPAAFVEPIPSNYDKNLLDLLTVPFSSLLVEHAYNVNLAKIEEGLLFNPSSWEFIGFVDLEYDDASLASYL